MNNVRNRVMGHMMPPMCDHQFELLVGQVQKHHFLDLVQLEFQIQGLMDPQSGQAKNLQHELILVRIACLVQYQLYIRMNLHEL